MAGVDPSRFEAISGGVAPFGVTKPSYCAMVVLIQLVLLPMHDMDADMNYDPTDDWVEDCKGADPMDYPSFFDCMFELADMWVDNVSAAEYTKLLMDLLKGRRAGAPGAENLKRGPPETDANDSRLLDGFGYQGPPEKDANDSKSTGPITGQVEKPSKGKGFLTALGIRAPLRRTQMTPSRRHPFQIK
eukprot:gene18472-24964_t